MIKSVSGNYPDRLLACLNLISPTFPHEQCVHAPGDGSVEYYGSWKQDRYHGKGVMVVRDSWKFTGAPFTTQAGHVANVVAVRSTCHSQACARAMHHQPCGGANLDLRALDQWPCRGVAGWLAARRWRVRVSWGSALRGQLAPGRAAWAWHADCTGALVSDAFQVFSTTGLTCMDLHAEWRCSHNPSSTCARAELPLVND